MARWEGNARGRLERAALDLFTEQGYDRTTVAQIAQRANLTERSFYRWFADKREVLFAGDELAEKFLAAIDAVPAGTGALPTLLAAFAVTPQVLRPRAYLCERAAIIAANPPLQERELIKQAWLSETLTAALTRRGHDRQAARLAVDVGAAVLRLTIERYLADEQADFARLLSQSAADMLTVAADAAPPHPAPGKPQH
ncbi:TetR/AcrR family transcriptional regulator [Mangrovihabitans endophyticus]|uniref:TetR family transcriptional regulator n=1 Tax=Mangrovihabitans endophyticus TaxID=1751298 RepID=A0A8J3BVW1_9ACTN|nr:TetR/AcrR family transcriptional regulator [Mangrovihabitans endophyticus]GGK77847.1 TetR family transcriptional regulator [Mangrovihabitans endophyticus]